MKFGPRSMNSVPGRVGTFPKTTGVGGEGERRGGGQYAAIVLLIYLYKRAHLQTIISTITHILQLAHCCNRRARTSGGKYNSKHFTGLEIMSTR